MSTDSAVTDMVAGISLLIFGIVTVFLGAILIPHAAGLVLLIAGYFMTGVGIYGIAKVFLILLLYPFRKKPVRRSAKTTQPMFSVPKNFTLSSKVRLTITVTGGMLDILFWPAEYLNKLIKKTQKHQRAWKKAEKKNLYMGFDPEPKEMITMFRVLEGILLIVWYCYLQFLNAVLKVRNFFTGQ